MESIKIGTRSYELVADGWRMYYLPARGADL